MVKFTKSKNDTGGPSSAIGIMRFFDADSTSPKLDPYFLMAAIILFIIVMLVLSAMY